LNRIQERRRSRIIDRKFQLGLAFRLVLVLTVSLAAGIALAFAPSFYVLATTNDLDSLEPASIEFLMLHRRLWPAALLSFAGIFYYAIRVSHRIAGPLYRLNEVLRALLENRDPGLLKIRKGDYPEETAELVERLAKKILSSNRGAPASSDPE